VITASVFKSTSFTDYNFQQLENHIFCGETTGRGTAAERIVYTVNRKSVIFMVCANKTNFDLENISKKSSIEIMSPLVKIRL
jgi:hypothetical protein